MHQAEIAAAQAYIRLLAATRAVIDDPDDAPQYMPLLTSPIEEADEALRNAGLMGNEDRLFTLVRQLRPSMTGSGR
ncbi:hypothetical protein ACIRJR_33555 [Streptomyces sp. NPDC102402]|uniref:hypothetical protein n=1 Tax=Streptomyces sp. NPDC102402 TaxID=3366169 RepID=UPI0038004867